MCALFKLVRNGAAYLLSVWHWLRLYQLIQEEILRRKELPTYLPTYLPRRWSKYNKQLGFGKPYLQTCKKGFDKFYDSANG